MVEMQVAGIALDAASRSPIVLLQDPSGRRQVPIWIDQAQAQNILAGINRERPPRPLSHDLMAQILTLAGLRLERVVVHAIEDNTFRAVLKLINEAGESTELDARPSDAIALALRTDSTIWMLEEVVADASIPVDAEADAEDQEDFRRFLDRTSPAELIRHLHKAAPEGSPPEGMVEGEEPVDDSHADGPEDGQGAPEHGDSPS
ncbi:MAG: bifunctional nuclease family protein [Cyanobium sp.]|jgi:bifunctional DNase/RNase